MMSDARLLMKQFREAHEFEKKHRQARNNKKIVNGKSTKIEQMIQTSTSSSQSIETTTNTLPDSVIYVAKKLQNDANKSKNPQVSHIHI